MAPLPSEMRLPPPQVVTDGSFQEGDLQRQILQAAFGTECEPGHANDDSVQIPGSDPMPPYDRLATLDPQTSSTRSWASSISTPSRACLDLQERCDNRQPTQVLSVPNSN
jgi:hypothetical protein